MVHNTDWRDNQDVTRPRQYDQTLLPEKYSPGQTENLPLVRLVRKAGQDGFPVVGPALPGQPHHPVEGDIPADVELLVEDGPQSGLQDILAVVLVGEELHSDGVNLHSVEDQVLGLLDFSLL